MIYVVSMMDDFLAFNGSFFEKLLVNFFWGILKWFYCPERSFSKSCSEWCCKIQFYFFLAILWYSFNFGIQISALIKCWNIHFKSHIVVKMIKYKNLCESEKLIIQSDNTLFFLLSSKHKNLHSVFLFYHEFNMNSFTWKTKCAF